MKGYLWIVSEVGFVSKFYFDTDKREIKLLKPTEKDYEKGFLISAYVLRISKDSERGEFGYVKDNIVYHLKGSKIFVLVADAKIADSPYIYGFLRELGRRIYHAIDGIAILDEVEKLVKELLFNLPKPLPPVKTLDKDKDLDFIE